MTKSKSKARRTAKGLLVEENGVPASSSISSAVANKSQQSRVPVIDSVQASDVGGSTNGESSQPASAAPVVNAHLIDPLPDLPAGALVAIFSKATSTGPDGTIVVKENEWYRFPAVKVAAASKHFCKVFHRLPLLSPAPCVYKLVIEQGEAVPQAVVAYLDWFIEKTRAPYGPAYKGAKAVAIKDEWAIGHIAQVYHATKYLDLKAPFSNAQLFAIMRTYVDEDELDPAAIVAIWRFTSSAEQHLRDRVIRRVVEYLENIEYEESENGAGTEFATTATFENAFAKEASLMEAYKARRKNQEEWRVKQEQRQQQASEYQKCRQAGRERAQRLREEEHSRRQEDHAHRVDQVTRNRALMNLWGVNVYNPN